MSTSPHSPHSPVSPRQTFQEARLEHLRSALKSRLYTLRAGDGSPVTPTTPNEGDPQITDFEDSIDLRHNDDELKFVEKIQINNYYIIDGVKCIVIGILNGDECLIMDLSEYLQHRVDKTQLTKIEDETELNAAKKAHNLYLQCNDSRITAKSGNSSHSSSHLSLLSETDSVRPCWNARLCYFCMKDGCKACVVVLIVLVLAGCISYGGYLAMFEGTKMGKRSEKGLNEGECKVIYKDDVNHDCDDYFYRLEISDISCTEDSIIYENYYNGLGTCYGADDDEYDVGDTVTCWYDDQCIELYAENEDNGKSLAYWLYVAGISLFLLTGCIICLAVFCVCYPDFEWRWYCCTQTFENAERSWKNLKDASNFQL